MADDIIRLFRPTFDVESCLKELRDCLDQGWTGPGFKTDQFEAEWKRYTGLENAYFLNSCTAALNLTFDIFKEYYGWADDDEVISTPITFVSSNHAIKLAGLRPVFADIDDTLCLDPADVERKITNRTKAVLFVGIGGNVGHYREILEVCLKHNLRLIVDAAHMGGTRVDGRFPCYEADAVNFSFQTFKTLATADSGMLCFKNAALEKIARVKAWSGINTASYSEYAIKDHKTYKWHYDVEYVSNCYNGNSIMASVALAQLHCLDKDNAFRREIAARYDAAFCQYPNQIQLVEYAPDCESSRCLYQIIVKDRDGLVKYLNEHQINSGVHYVDNTNYRMYAYGRGTCPKAAYLSEHMISLPMHLKLADTDVEKVIHTVLDFVLQR